MSDAGAAEARVPSVKVEAVAKPVTAEKPAALQGENPDQSKPKDNATQVDEIAPEQINQLTSELTSQQNSVDADTATMILEIYASGRQMSQLCDRKAGELQAQAVKVEGGRVEVTDPQKLALALDLEIAGAKFKLTKLSENRKGKGQQSDTEKQLAARIKQLENERSEGKVKLMLDGKETVVNCAELKTAPNQITEMAKSLLSNLGLGEQQLVQLSKYAETNPMAAIEWLVSQAINNRDLRTGLMNNLRESALFGDDKAKKDALINFLDKNIESGSRTKKTKEVGKKVATGVGLMGAMMMLMMYISSKEKKQGPMG